MKPIEITSATNSQFKIFKSLLTSKGIKEEKLFILSGEKLIEEFLKEKKTDFKVEFLLFHDEIKVNTTAKVTRLSNELFKELDILGTHFNLLVISFVSISEKNLATSPQGLEVICPLGDPRNLGSMLRTALGFGVSEVILTSESTHPFLPQCLKASAGAALKIKLSLTQLKVSEIPLSNSDFALELHGTSLEKVNWPNNLRLWVGEEGPGLRLTPEQKKLMKFIHIPTNQIESLNASVSTALALWEWKKKSLN
jgi:TrmH family RNA methyltransferase